MDADDLLSELHRAATAVQVRLRDQLEWGPSGSKPGQYRSDLTADAAAVELLTSAGLAVVTEESGWHGQGREVTVVVDPLDGSTNAFHRVSYWAVSLCAVDAEGALASVVLDLVHGRRFDARRGGGARCDGQVIGPAPATRLRDAIVGLNGLPSAHLGWRQFRALGACALDLCAVAEGRLDAFVDCTDDGLAPWDILGGLLVCREAGAVVADVHGRDLVTTDPAQRFTPVAAADEGLLQELAAARRSTPPAPVG